jgi:hypothetical protein
MLNYAPDGMSGGGAFRAEPWSLQWSVESAPISKLPVSTPTRPAGPIFQPERMSGFCASS